MKDTKHKLGESVNCEKNGIEFSGTVIEVCAEMQYIIELPDGSQRSVDHCHILENI